MTDDAWRDEPLTKGVMYDALMATHKKMTRVTGDVMESVKQLTKWSPGLYQIADLCVRVAVDIPEEIAKYLAGEKNQAYMEFTRAKKLLCPACGKEPQEHNLAKTSWSYCRLIPGEVYTRIDEVLNRAKE